MQYKGHVLYVFTEIGSLDLSKIGSCSKGGRERFREGCFMNPRGLSVEAMWKMPDAASGRFQERMAHKLFQKLEGADGKEWFLSSPEEAVEKITQLLKRPPEFCGSRLNFSPEQVYTDDLYDEFREKGERYKGRLVQRRIWLHQESNNGLTKISHNTWWFEPGSRSTNAKRTTYNSRCRTLVGCLSFPVVEFDAEWERLVVDTNKKTVDLWDELVKRYGIPATAAGRVGWTETAPKDITMNLLDQGLVELPLSVTSPPRGVKSLNFQDR